MSRSLSPDLASKIVASILGEVSVVRTARLTGGVSADVFRVDVERASGESDTLVLRIHGETHSGHPAQLEYDLLRALHAAGVAVAEPLALDTSGRLIPEPWILMGFVEGTTRISAGESYFRQMAIALADVHRAPLEGLPALPRRIDPVPELFDFLPESPEWDEVRDHLAVLTDTAYRGEHCLLHGDFWPENLLWQNGRLAAILDWEDSAVGDPLSDVACCRLELRYLHDVTGMERFTAAYSRLATVDPDRLALWQLYVSAAAHKFMGTWGLAPERETHMRRTALVVMKESAGSIMGQAR